MRQRPSASCSRALPGIASRPRRVPPPSARSAISADHFDISASGPSSFNSPDSAPVGASSTGPATAVVRVVASIPLHDPVRWASPALNGICPFALTRPPATLNPASRISASSAVTCALTETSVRSGAERLAPRASGTSIEGEVARRSTVGPANGPLARTSSASDPRGSSPSSMPHRARRAASAVPVTCRSIPGSFAMIDSTPSICSEASSARIATDVSFSARPSNEAPPSRVEMRVCLFATRTVAGALSVSRPPLFAISSVRPGMASARSLCASVTSTTNCGAERCAMSSGAGSPDGVCDDSGRFIRPSRSRISRTRPLVTATSLNAMPVRLRPDTTER